MLLWLYQNRALCYCDCTGTERYQGTDLWISYPYGDLMSNISSFIKVGATMHVANLKQQMLLTFLCVLDRASSWYLNKGRPTGWHLLYYVNLLLNMFQMLIHPSSGASDYLLRCCVGWLAACWCYVAGLSVGNVVSECSVGWTTTSGSAYTRIRHYQQTIPLHNTSMPQVSLHNATNSR